MADDITNAELARRLDAFAREVREDIAGLNTRLEQYVLGRVYAAEQQVTNLRIAQLEARAKEVEDSRRAERQQNEDQRRATSRWIVAAIVVPVLTTIATLLLSLVGP